MEILNWILHLIIVGNDCIRYVGRLLNEMKAMV